MDNLSSIQYFLPEFLIILLALAVILFDLLSFKKWINPLLLLGFVFIALLLYQLPKNGGFIFNNMLINDSFSYFFKWIIFISTFSIIIHHLKSTKQLKNQFILYHL